MSSGRFSKAFASFNLENQSQVLPTQFRKALEELVNIRTRANKGIADHVRVLDDKFERFEVFGGECRNVNLRLGEIDAFLGAKLLPFRTRLRDLDGNRIRVYGANDAANFAVVKPDRVAGIGMLENLRQSNPDLGLGEKFARSCHRWQADPSHPSASK